MNPLILFADGQPAGNPDLDFAKAMLPFCGGVLAFAAAAMTIINNRLQKAQNKQERDRIIRVTMSVSGLVIIVVADVFWLGFGATRTGLSLTALSLIIALINYLRSPGYPSRFEVVLICLILMCLAGLLFGLIFQFSAKYAKP